MSQRDYSSRWEIKRLLQKGLSLQWAIIHTCAYVHACVLVFMHIDHACACVCVMCLRACRLMLKLLSGLILQLLSLF